MIIAALIRVLVGSAVPQMHTAYLAEKDGNLQHLIEAFDIQRRYMENYYQRIELYSVDDNWEGTHELGVHASLVETEMAHLHPFRQRLLKGFRLAGLTSVSLFKERYSVFPLIEGLRSTKLMTSSDGSVSTAVALVL